MTDRAALGREALRCALHLRRARAIPREAAVNVYDIAQASGATVRFADLKSTEGLFVKQPGPIIILPSLRHRPRGRVTYSCAHELGHFQLGHGTRVDEYVGDAGAENRENEEFAADTFAATLLMPRTAILRRFEARGWNVESASPLQVFTIAGELDVGYSTLLGHMQFQLDMVTERWRGERSRVTPKELRAEIVGSQPPNRVVVIDEFWDDVPIDFEVGDVLAIRRELPIGDCAVLADFAENHTWRLLQAAKSGRSQLTVSGRQVSIRVARSGFCGDLRYRFLEEDNDE